MRRGRNENDECGRDVRQVQTYRSVASTGWNGSGWVSRAAKLFGALGSVLVIGALGFGIAALDPNALKPRIEQAVLDATGRAISLNGPVRIGWSLQPTFEVNDVTLANVPGGTRPDIVRIERIEAQLSIPALFHREIEVTRLILTGPNILFEQVAGKPNWIPDQPPTASVPPPLPPSEGASPLKLRIRAIHITNGMITWRFPSRTKVVGVRSLELTQALNNGPVGLASVLVYSDNRPFNLGVSAQPSGGLRDPWAAKIQFSAFDTTASASGTVDLAGTYDLQIDATAGALEKLNALLPEMHLPPLHEVTLSTHIRNGPTLGALPVIGATRLRFKEGTIPEGLPVVVLGATDLSLPRAGGIATVTSVGRMGAQAFTLDGTFEVPLHPDGRVSVPIDIKAQAVAGGGKVVSAREGSLVLKGMIALDVLRFAGLDAAATLHTPSLAALRPLVSQSLPALNDVRFDGRVAVPADRQSISFKSATLLTHEGDVLGDWTLGLRSGLAMTGKLVSPRLDLDTMLAAFGVALPPAPALGDATGPVISTVPLPWGSLRGPSVDLSARIAAMTFQGQAWKDVDFVITLKGGRLAVSPVTLSLPAGAAQLALTVDASTDTVPVSVDFHAPGIPLALVARYVGLPGPMAGAVRIDARLRGTGRSPHEIASTLAGPVSATLVGGHMTNAALIMLTSPSLDALGINVPAQGTTQLQCLGLEGSFDKGIGLLRTIVLDTTYLTLDGSGQVDFGKETVALKLSPLAQIAGSSVTVPVMVEGPFRSVHGRLDADGFDKLGLFIDGLFGGDHSTACADSGFGPVPERGR